MSLARIQACALRSITPHVMHTVVTVVVELELTPAQRFAAVEDLLGSGMSQQEAYDGLRALFPGWFTEERKP